MKKRLGEILVASGAVSPADVEAALNDQSMGEPARLGDLLVSMGKLSTHELARALAQQHNVPFTELPPIPSSILELVPMDFQRQFRFVPLKVGKGSISIAMADLSHASTDVLPVLRRRFPTVQLFVAPGDAIDAVHAAVTGQYESPGTVALPSVAPAIAPVISAALPAGTEDDPFGSIDLDFPSELADEPVPGGGLFQGAPLAAASAPLAIPFSFESTPPRPSMAEGSAPRVAQGTPEDAPFFATAPRARPVTALSDHAFVAGVPMSSPSSLAKLVIEPELPALPIVSPTDLRVTAVTARSSAVQSRPPPSPAPPAEAPRATRQTLPEWLQHEVAAQSNGADPEGWSEALDALAPSKLILAVTKALLRRGVLTEQDILEASEPKKE
jgi:hypothetical protein